MLPVDLTELVREVGRLRREVGYLKSMNCPMLQKNERVGRCRCQSERETLIEDVYEFDCSVCRLTEEEKRIRLLQQNIK